MVELRRDSRELLDATREQADTTCWKVDSRGEVAMLVEGSIVELLIWDNTGKDEDGSSLLFFSRVSCVTRASTMTMLPRAESAGKVRTTLPSPAICAHSSTGGVVLKLKLKVSVSFSLSHWGISSSITTSA